MTGPNHRQPIPTIVADTTATRHRVTPAVHDAGDLSIPPRARAVGVEAYRRQLEDASQLSDLEIATKALSDRDIHKSVAEWAAKIIVGALADAGRL